MLVDKNNLSQITIKISSDVNPFGLQRVLDYIKYLEATSKSKAKQVDADKLADEINAAWWNKNKKRFIS
jgi:hypothetical protein